MAKRSKRLSSGELMEFMRHFNACSASTVWVHQNRAFDAETLWNHCNRFDWIVWLADLTVYSSQTTDALRVAGIDPGDVPCKVTKRERDKFMRHVKWSDVATAIRSRLGGV